MANEKTVKRVVTHKNLYLKSGETGKPAKVPVGTVLTLTEKQAERPFLKGKTADPGDTAKLDLTTSSEKAIEAAAAHAKAAEAAKAKK